jgi:hypothetical protein
MKLQDFKKEIEEFNKFLGGLPHKNKVSTFYFFN